MGRCRPAALAAIGIMVVVTYVHLGKEASFVNLASIDTSHAPLRRTRALAPVVPARPDRVGAASRT